MKKKNAIMLADTRPALVGTVLCQLKATNPNLFDEAIIYYSTPICEKDREIMQQIMPCRFVHYEHSWPQNLFRKPRFKLFSELMFVRYEMFSYLEEFETITWIDTDILIQGDLSGMIEAARKTGAAFICEDPENKTAEKPDRMRTCFTEDIRGYDMNRYLYCSGTIVLTDKMVGYTECTAWCYQKTVEWADALQLPDQGVLNAAIQEFNIKVSPLKGAEYCCYPYMGRDCSDAKIIHAWGRNKFWNDWYVYQKYSGWQDYYDVWCKRGGSPLSFKIQPKISVVIPSYKPNLTLLQQSLDSLMSQKRSDWERYSDFEIIIVAEPFNQEEIQTLIDNYHDPRIKLIFNEERKGIAASINRGMREAAGTYIARIDDDDLAAVYRMFEQAEYLDQHQDIHLCTSDFEYFGDMNERRVSFEGDMAHAWSMLTCPFDHPTVMFRKDFFFDNNLFYDEERGFVEDWELWRRAFAAGMKVGCIHKVLFYHRWMNTGSAGQTNKTVVMMREMIQKNFRELGVEIPTEDLPIMGPWNGRLVNEDDYHKLETYFSEAVANNSRKKLYDAECLQRVFDLRLAEAKTGILPGLSEKVAKKRENAEALPQNYVAEREHKPSFIRRILKRILKPLYQPFRHRYEQPIEEIRQNVWDISANLSQSKDFKTDLKDSLYDVKTDLTLIKDSLYDIKQSGRFHQNLGMNQLLQKKKVVLIGTPEHSNIGDAAITLGEQAFFQKYFGDYAYIELSTYDVDTWYTRFKSVIGIRDIIFLQGGGNLGNRYPREEELRKRVISDFPENQVVILPQTIFYSDDAQGHDALLASCSCYERHQQLTVFTRGEQSLQHAKNNFQTAICAYAPDMALMLQRNFNLPREGILLCLRGINDTEANLSAEQISMIRKAAEKFDPNYEVTNNLNEGDSEKNIYQEYRRHVVDEELKKFAGHQIVVTDRLHGIIFSIITKTPCIVLNSSGNKIPEFVEKFSDSNALFYLGMQLDGLEDAIRKAQQVKDPRYPLLECEPFTGMAKLIKEQGKK